MILSDTEVWERIENGPITIEPKPSQPHADSSVWQSMALDIHLGEGVYKIRSKEVTQFIVVCRMVTTS
jgi:deoxycytidine triphosphate deaminase